MFLLGLLLGPALGFLLVDAARPRVHLGPWTTILAAAFLLALLALLPIGDIELRLGLVAGIPLGALLSVTPQSAALPE